MAVLSLPIFVKEKQSLQPFFNTELVRLLVESGASKEKRDCHGQTALLLACKMNNLPIAQYLISVKANVNAVDKVS